MKCYNIYNERGKHDLKLVKKIHVQHIFNAKSKFDIVCNIYQCTEII